VFTLFILDKLDVVSSVSLKLTSKRFFHTVCVKKKHLDACVGRNITCLLEIDQIERGALLPEILACCFCKVKHQSNEFGSRSKIEYGS